MKEADETSKMTMAVKVNTYILIYMYHLNIKCWILWLTLVCSFVTKVKGKDVHLLLEDVQSLEENDDKVRVVDSNILILSKVPSRKELICCSKRLLAKKNWIIVSISRDYNILETWPHVGYSRSKLLKTVYSPEYKFVFMLFS